MDGCTGRHAQEADLIDQLAKQRQRTWEDLGPHNWGFGVAMNIIGLERRLDAVTAALVAQAAGAVSEDRCRLTGGERNALLIASEAYALDKDDPVCVRIASDLRGLLERMK